MRAFWAILLLSTALAAQTYDFSALDALMTQAATAVPPGLEVLIVQNGQTLYSKQFGRWPKNRQTPIASATKWLSGAVIMSLVDDGLLSLDDKASQYLPYLTGEKANITIRQLMSHTSGFPGEFPVADPCLSSASGTLDQCAQALAKVPLQIPAGTGFIYAGADMQIAGRVAEVVSGKDFQTLFRERIATPLGLTDTDYEYKGPTQNPRISGGGRSTATDYMRFLTMIYQRGVYNGHRVLSTRAIDEMLKDQTAGVPIIESPMQGYGDLNPNAPLTRYGIGNWLDSAVNSSPGALGFSPVIDARRNLLVVVAMENLLQNFAPYYFQMTQLLGTIIPVAQLTPRGITNAASYESGPLAPGEIVTLFGSGFGTGAQVLVDEFTAPVIYSSATQVSAIVPFGIEGRSMVNAQVIYNGLKSPSVPMPVSNTWPALLTANASGTGQGAILNQDGTINSTANPASRGSVVVLFGTGAGQTNPSSQDGAVSMSTGTFTNPVRVSIGGIDVPRIDYAGPAPGLVAGVAQFNVVVPSSVSPGANVPVVVTVGGLRSPSTVTLAVK